MPSIILSFYLTPKNYIRDAKELALQLRDTADGITIANDPYTMGNK